MKLNVHRLVLKNIRNEKNLLGLFVLFYVCSLILKAPWTLLTDHAVLFLFLVRFCVNIPVLLPKIK